MPPDCYKIEVIHYLNPHQIWIEVNPSVVKDKFLFEQIGLYGLLPLEKTLNILTDDLKVLKCEEWLPGAAAVIKDSLEESDEVWFSPTDIVKRSSIFDDNIYKYGEIIFKTKNGKFEKLSKKLIKSGFAYKNVCEFHKKLSNGQLKTKLSPTKTQEVIRNLENYCLGHKDKPKNMWIKSVREQTSVELAYQDFELSLTELNLDDEIKKKILKNKYNDFALCKDIDDESVGRANRKMKSTIESDKQVPKSQFILKRLLISKNTESLNQMYSGNVKGLVSNSKVKDLNQTNESASTSKHNTSSEIDAVGAKKDKENFISYKLKLYRKMEEAKKSADQESERDVNKVESTVAAEVGHLLETPKIFENEHPVQDFKIEQKHIKKYLFRESIDETDSSANPFEEETSCDKFKEEKDHTCNNPLCKDIDDQSVGRANGRMKSTIESDKQVPISQFILKRLLISKKAESWNQMYSGIVKGLVANSKVKDLNQTNESASTSKHNTSSEIDALGAKKDKENFISYKLKLYRKMEEAKKSADQESERDVNKVESTVAAEVGHLLETPKIFENEHPVQDFKIEQKHIKKYLFRESIDETDSSANPFEEETRSGNQFKEETKSGNQFGGKIKSGNKFQLKTLSGNQLVLETKSGDQYEGKRRSGYHFEEKSGFAHQMKEKKSGYHIEEKTSCDKFKEEKDHTCNSPRRSGKPMDNRNFHRIAFGPPGLDPKYFKIQVIKPLDYEEKVNKKKELDIERVEKSEKRDSMYGYVDSDVEM